MLRRRKITLPSSSRNQSSETLWGSSHAAGASPVSTPTTWWLGTTLTMRRARTTSRPRTTSRATPSRGDIRTRSWRTTATLITLTTELAEDTITTRSAAVRKLVDILIFSVTTERNPASLETMIRDTITRRDL